MIPSMRMALVVLGCCVAGVGARAAELKPFPLPGAGAVRAVAFSPDGKRLACGCDDATVRLIDPASGNELHRLAHRAAVETVAFAPDGTLATAGRDRVIRLWDADGKLQGELAGHRIGVTGLAFAAGGSVLVSGGHDGLIRLWDWKAGREVRRLEGHDAEVRAVAVSADGGRLASASYDHTARVWDAKTGKELRFIVTMKREATSVALAPDGRRVAAVGIHERARLWRIDTGDDAIELDRGTGFFSSLTFSADGHTLAGAGDDPGTAILWETHAGAVRRVLPLAKVRALGIAFSRDGGRVALALNDGSVAVHPLVATRAIADAEKAWEVLRSTDGEAAFDAILTLAADPVRSLAFFRQHIAPVRALEAKRLERLLADLDSDTFATREGATRELEGVAELVAAAVRKQLQDDTLSLEVRTRMERVLRPVDKPLLSGEQLRSARVVECLERMGTVDARQFLNELAKGAPGAVLTEHARAARPRSGERGWG